MKTLSKFKIILTTACVYLIFSDWAFAASYQFQKVSFKSAFIQLCLEADRNSSAEECYHKLYLNPGTEIRYGFSSKASSYVKECFNKVMNEYSRRQIRQTPVFEITGFITEGPGYSVEEPVVKFFHILDSKNLCDIVPQ